MIKAFLTNVFINGVASAIGSVAIIFVVSQLAPSVWGLSAAVLGGGQFLGSALSFGSQTERVKRYSRLGKIEATESARQDSIARVAVGLSLAATAGFVILLGGAILGAALLAAAGVYVGIGTTNFRVSQRAFGQAGIRTISEKLVALLIVASAAAFGAVGATTLPIAIGIGGLVVGVADLLALRPRGADVRAGLTRRVIGRQWSRTFYYGIASLTPSLLLLDSIVVIAFSDATQAGYLSVGSKLVAPMSIAATAIVTALLPYLSAGSARVLPRIHGVKTGIALSAFGALMAAVFLLADYWVPWLFGREYLNAVWPVRLYVLNVVVVLFTRVGVTILQAWDDQKVAGVLVSVQAVTALIGIGVGSYFGGALGGSFALVLTNIVLAVVLLRRVRALAADSS